jgi:hypothetical protein
LHWVPADGGEHRTRLPEPTDDPRDPQVATNTAAPAGPYPVGEVKGRYPAGLGDFLGVASFTVSRGELTYRVFGTGEQDADRVRFRQQDLGRDGRDSRTWLITATPNGIVADPDFSSGPGSLTIDGAGA